VGDPTNNATSWSAGQNHVNPQFKLATERKRKRGKKKRRREFASKKNDKVGHDGTLNNSMGTLKNTGQKKREKSQGMWRVPPGVSQNSGRLNNTRWGRRRLK